MKSISKLHRRLSPRGENIFSLTIGGATFGDRDITSISITRGQSGYSYGIQPSTLEVEVIGLHASKANYHTELKITGDTLTRLGQATSIPVSQLQWRFYGQIGLQDSTDNGIKRSYTQFSASSYSSLLRPTARKYTVRDKTLISNVLIHAIQHPQMSGRIRVFPLSQGAGEWDTTYIESLEGMTFSEIMSKYATDLKVLICERRDGAMHVQSLKLREEYLKDRASSRYAPLRAHTLSPATWSQPTEQRSKQLYQLERLSDGQTRRRMWDVATPPQGVEYPVEEEDVDLTHVRRETENNDRILRALNYQSNYPRVQLSSVKFDLLYMLTSSNWYDRRMAGELLRLEHGDAVYFSGDWQGLIRYPMIAQQIKETITPDNWTIELDLEHPSSILGLHGDQIPKHPPRVWDQATSQWDNETRKWQEA